MLRFLLARLGQSAVVLLAMSFATYVLLGLMPGDPIDLMFAADPDITSEDIARLKALHGLDQPLIDRYIAWLTNALAGEFGYSRLLNEPVFEVLAPRLANSLLLMAVSLAIAIAIAVPAGIHAALRPGSWSDQAINLCCFAGVSIPPFWFALLLILLFAVVLGLLPAGGMGHEGDGVLERLRHMVLPVLTLSAAAVAGYTRHVRSAMIEVMREEYIRTARAKGVAERHVVRRHALRNALIPVVTIAALDVGGLFSGALITETMFGWLGMGKTIYDAVMGNDYNLALVGLLLATLVTLLANILADIAYAWLDPRITYRSGVHG